MTYATVSAKPSNHPKNSDIPGAQPRKAFLLKPIHSPSSLPEPLPPPTCPQPYLSRSLDASLSSAGPPDDWRGLVPVLNTAFARYQVVLVLVFVLVRVPVSNTAFAR